MIQVPHQPPQYCTLAFINIAIYHQYFTLMIICKAPPHFTQATSQPSQYEFHGAASEYLILYVQDYRFQTICDSVVVGGDGLHFVIYLPS